MKLVEEIAVPAASPDYAASKNLGPTSHPAELLECDLLEFDQTGRSWANWSAWFGSQGIAWTRPDDQMIYRAHASVLAQALSGRGLILTWGKIRRDLFERNMLIEVGPSLTNPDMGHHLVWPPALGRDEGFRRLREWLVSAALAD